MGAFPYFPLNVKFYDVCSDNSYKLKFAILVLIQFKSSAFTAMVKALDLN